MVSVPDRACRRTRQHQLGALQRLRSARHRERAPWRCRGETRSSTDPFGCEHVDAHPTAQVAMRDPVGRRTGQREPSRLDRTDECSNRAGDDARVDEHVEIGRHARRHDAVFERVQQHHLTTDERPLPRPHRGQLDQRQPQVRVVAGKRRKPNRFACDDWPRHRRAANWAPARRERASSDSRRSTATTGHGANLSPAANGQSSSSTTRKITFGRSARSSSA